METISASQAATLLGTDARTLRRFLRRDKTYRSAGPGGRYEFTEKDIPTLRRHFDAWQAKNQARVTYRPTPVQDDPEDYATPIEIPKLTLSLRQEIRAQEDRLLEQVRAAGLSVGQLRRADRREIGV